MSGAGDSSSDKAGKAHETGTALVVANGETASAESAAAATGAPSRATIAAAAIGFIAGAALLVAAGGVMGIGHLFAASTQLRTAKPVVSAETQALQKTVTRLETLVATLKANVETANRRAKAQRGQMTERYEHTARTQTEIQSRIAKLNETVERLDKRVTTAAAVETTGSIAPRHAAAAATAGTTGSIAPRYAAAAAARQPAPAGAEPKQRPILRGWVIRSIYNGRAVVANRRGAFEAAPGLFVPGLGQIEAVTRQGGRWVVIAERGMIRSMLRPPRPRAEIEYELFR